MTLKKLLHNFNGHLHTVNSHRRLVRKYCFKLGLYRQGMMHDLSKYSPSEFIPGVKYYQDGHRSPNNAQREDEGVSKAWLHHKGRNKHHFEYWIDYDVAKHLSNIFHRHFHSCKNSAVTFDIVIYPVFKMMFVPTLMMQPCL